MKRRLGRLVALWVGCAVILVACGRSTEVSAPVLKPLAPTSYYLSDLLWESAKNTFGPVEKDSSNGDKVGGDGRTLTINGKTYTKGLGMTSPSEIVYKLAGRCSSFSAEVGVDDLWNSTRGSVVFQVFADNVKIWDSGLMTYTNAFRATGILNIAGKQQLKLVTTDGGNGGGDDYADWAIPVITCDPAPPALASADATTKGVFGSVEAWPTIPTHAALLPDSTIISWYSRDTNGATRNADYNDQSKHNFTLVDLWKFDNGSHTRRDNLTTDLFCAGFAPTADGRLLVAGGNLGMNSSGFYPGSVHTNFYNPSTATWSRGPNMTEGRWYPSVINLPNREVLLIGGNSNETTRYNSIADVWNPTTNALRRLTEASTQGRSFNHLYPQIYVAPNGQVFYTGPTARMSYLNTSGAGGLDRLLQT